MNGLVRRSHPPQSLGQVCLGEPPRNRNAQMLIQCRDDMNTTFFRLKVAILFAGRLLPLGKRHEGAPATLIDLSLLCWFPDSAEDMPVLKLANY